MKVVNMPLGELLQILELKTNFTFSYLNEELPLGERVTLNSENEPLQQILEILSDRFALTFTRISNIITIKKNQNVNGKNKLQVLGILRGIVRDSATSEVLPYANVYIQEINTGVGTDNRGFFIIPSIPAKKEYTIIVSFVGYLPKKIKVFIEENKITDMDIYLAKSTIEIESVMVYGERANEAEVTVQKISIKEIENMTFGVETDVMRSIQLQPGVQSAGDVSAKYYVRGGASNENLVLLNEIPIYNPFHALGIFSVIDPEMINSVEFYKGGFGAKYDGRLSSVMNIITKDGNRNNFAASVAVSQLTVKSSLEGPVPNGSFIITGRKSYSNEILKKFTNNKSIPIDFYDASFKVNYSNPEFLPISKFTFFGFLSKDKIDYKNKLHADFNWLNSHLGFNWFTATQNSPLFVELTLYYSKFSGSEIPNSSNNRSIENGVDDITFKTDFNYVLSDRNEYYGGIKINFIKTKLFLANSTGKLKNVGSEGTMFSGYSGFRVLSLNKFKADFGSRLNALKLAEGPSLFFEPRLNLTYSLLPTLNLKAAWGIYQQELVTISDEDEVLALFEPWIVTPEYLKLSNSIHYIGGYDYYLTEKLKISMEGYFKVMHNLAVLNDELIYPTDKQLINASGESHGAEMSVNYNDGWINAWLAYSYSWTTKKLRDIEYHPRYDSRNAIKIFINCELGNNWRASISWIYNSGMPFTQIFGYYNNYNPSEILNPSSLLTDYAYFPILADRNAAHLPDYHRLDMNLSKKIRLWFMDLSIELNVINIYDRKNFFYFDTKTGERVNMLPFLPSIDIKAEL
ncbi:MAG TPA: carboxypeptidase-like regulatory domain-containing protein [Ignavibacteriaceae bacterium]|nr:carboxypeptidase-like regulatory domain-containing protein [Ignavibacteriaceae bacterium]